jgi:outer membrane protein
MRLNTRHWRKFKWMAFAVLIFGFTAVCWADQPVQQKLTIDQAIQIATANSLQRQIAQDDVKIARDKLAQAFSAYGPKLTIEGGYNHYNEQPTDAQLAQNLVDLANNFGAQKPNIDDSLNYYGYHLQLSQPLYTGHKLTATKNAAKANQKNAQANLTSTDNDLVLSVKRAYYTVLLCKQMEITMNEAVSSMEDHLREANAYYKVDLVPKLDVLRAEERLADLKQKQLLAQNNLTLAKTTFNFVLGVDLNTGYSFENKMESGSMPQDLQAYQNEALAQRPELEGINAKIDMAKQALLIAKSGLKPTVALVADHYHYEPINEAPSTSVGVVGTMKLFESGMTLHQIAEAEDTLKQAQTGKELLQRGIKLEVEQAYHNVEAAQKTVEVAQKSLDTAQETLQVASTRYKVGLSTSLERLDAEVGLTQAKTNYTQALSMYNIAVAELDRAIGKRNISK